MQDTNKETTIHKSFRIQEGSTGQKNKCEKTKLIFVVLDASHVRLFYQPRVFLMWFEHEGDSNLRAALKLNITFL